MARERHFKPELHEPALAFIRRMTEFHAAGSGKLSLLELLELFDLKLGDQATAKIRSRGDLVFTRQAETGGVFENSSSAVEFKIKDVKVTIPKTIEGNYVSLPNSVSMTFDDRNTISGGILFLRERLKDVQVDQERISIDISGDSFDQLIIHRPDA